MSEPERTPRTMPQITVPVANLRAFPSNYQTHDRAQIEQLAIGLGEIGQWKGIVIARPADDPELQAGEYYILAGHGLVEAARVGGYTHLVAQDWSTLSLDDARRLLVADNETARLAHPDAARLLALVEQVRATGRSVPGVTSERLAEIAVLARGVDVFGTAQDMPADGLRPWDLLRAKKGTHCAVRIGDVETVIPLSVAERLKEFLQSCQDQGGSVRESLAEVLLLGMEAIENRNS